MLKAVENEIRIESGFLTLSTEFSTGNRENSVESPRCYTVRKGYYRTYSFHKAFWSIFSPAFLNEYTGKDKKAEMSIRIFKKSG